MGLPAWLGVAGTALNVIGARSEGSATASAYAYQAQVARYNAMRAEMEGDIVASSKGMESRARVGAIKAGFAGQGIDVNSPTAAAVTAAQEELGQLDVATIKSNAAARAYGYRTEARLLKKQSKQAAVAGQLNAISSLIGGASSLYSSWAGWQNMAGGQKLGVGTSNTGVMF
jgi:hypothetical protein